MSRIPAKAKESAILTDVQKMRRAAYVNCAELAKKNKVPVYDLIMMLKEISEDVYTAGVDKTLARAKLADMDNIADAFDLSWLSPLAIKINNYKPRSRRATRI